MISFLESAPRRRSASPTRLRAFGQVAFANALFTALSFITSPITAHALQPAGRGDLAAVLVPYTWSILLFSLGLPTYAARAAANEEREQLGSLLGTVGVVAAVLGLAGIVIGIPLAGVLARHNALVHRLILVGLITLPVSLVASVGLGVANGLEEWSRLNVMRVLPPLLTVVAYVTLLVLGSLTVTAAVIVTWCTGLLSTIPLIGIVRRHRPLSFDRALLRRALSFGPRAWVGTLASTANARLDQLLMIPLVVPRQLGLYAVAVNVSALDGFLVSALSTVIGPSVARGNRDLIARAVRVTIAADAAFGVGFALVARWLMPLVFGARFSAALPMTYVLLAASVPGAAVWVLGTALQNAGYPGVPARGEILALIVTIAGLIVLLPSLAGLGAAIVSGAAYTTNAVLQIGLARRRLQIPVRDMLVVKRSDIDFLLDAGRARLAARSARTP
jgi:O-antigen/teichoic acid export membrane protein